MNAEKSLRFVVYVGVFLLLLNPSIDPDWGWHLKYGEFFFKNHRLLLNNVFSYTMPNFVWVNHSWGYDLLLYILYHLFGFFGLSIFSAFLGVLSFFLLAKNFRLKLWQLIIAGCVFTQLTFGIFWQGLRSQTVGFFMLSLMLYFMVIYRKNNKAAYFLPLLFLVWVNLHGSFAFGIGAFGIYVLTDFFIQLFIQRKSLNNFLVPKKTYLIFLSFWLSLLATFINPFFHKVYFEAFSRLSGPTLQTVEEWRSVSPASPLGIVLLAYISFLLFGFYKKKSIENLPYLVLTLIGGYFGFHALRFVGFFVLLSFPMLLLTLQQFQYKSFTMKIVIYVLLCFILIDFLIEVYGKNNNLVFSYSDYCRVSSTCSETLVKTLLKNPPTGKGFNSYATGGYLIGRGFVPKVFIDGRMHLWKENGYSAFEDYVKIYFNTDKKTFDKYGFDWLLIETNSVLAQKIESRSFGNWKKVYEGRNVIYFKRV